MTHAQAIAALREDPERPIVEIVDGNPAIGRCTMRSVWLDDDGVLMTLAVGGGAEPVDESATLDDLGVR
jgi:hypothetical protein